MHQPAKPTLAELIADHKGTEAALQKAARQAVLDSAHRGFPVSTLKDGKVVLLQPQEVFALVAEMDKESNGQHKS